MLSNNAKWLICPGETLADVLQSRNMSQEALSRLTGADMTYIKDVISGNSRITDDFAQELENAFGVSKVFWMKLQAKYDTELAACRRKVRL